MKIYRCDRCGHEASVPCIEDTDQRGFFTLLAYYREPGINDLCSRCMRQFHETIREASHDQLEQTKKAANAFLTEYAVVAQPSAAPIPRRFWKPYLKAGRELMARKYRERFGNDR